MREGHSSRTTCSNWKGQPSIMSCAAAATAEKVSPTINHNSNEGALGTTQLEGVCQAPIINKHMGRHTTNMLLITRETCSCLVRFSFAFGTRQTINTTILSKNYAPSLLLSQTFKHLRSHLFLSTHTVGRYSIGTKVKRLIRITVCVHDWKEEPSYRADRTFHDVSSHNVGNSLGEWRQEFNKRTREWCRKKAQNEKVAVDKYFEAIQ